jgi:DNA polymerase I-like protein with 3'-5' exonuclease and polymerase domains
MQAEKHPRFKPTRELAKRINFGKLGGMGAARLVATPRADDFDLTLGGHLGSDPIAIAERSDAIWRATFPEVDLYFREISRKLREGGGDYFTIRSANDGLIRGRVGFCDGCNHYFQNFVAQWTKDSVYALQREAYSEPDSPFYGSRIVIVPHDEIIAEVPEHCAPEAAARQCAVMIAVAQAAAPDVPIEADAALMRRWYKRAEPAFDAAGRLIPWEPKAHG